MYSIKYAEGVEDDLADLRAHERVRILDSIEEQLKREPTRLARNRKSFSV
jgi:mRNA-degrading endonuclease RelE of RelBE toxin-antitoxin system